MTLGVIITIRFQEDSSFSFLLFYLIYLFIYFFKSWSGILTCHRGLELWKARGIEKEPFVPKGELRTRNKEAQGQGETGKRTCRRWMSSKCHCWWQRALISGPRRFLFRLFFTLRNALARRSKRVGTFLESEQNVTFISTVWRYGSRWILKLNSDERKCHKQDNISFFPYFCVTWTIHRDRFLVKLRFFISTT